MRRLEEKMSDTHGALRSEIDAVKEIVTGISAQVDRESQTLQSQSTQQVAGLESRVSEELSLVRSNFEEQMKSSSNQVSAALQQLDQQTLQCNEGITTIIGLENQLKSIADKVTTEVFRVQEQDDKHYVDLNHTLDVKMANQEEHMLLLVQQTDGVGPIQQDVKLMKKKVNEDIRLVLSEITRIQKALQVDYLPPSTVKARGRKMSDPHRKSRDESASSALAVEAFTSTTPVSSNRLGLERIKSDTAASAPNTTFHRAAEALMGPRKSKSLRRPASKAVEVESAELEVDDLPPSRPQSPMQKRFKDFGIQAEAQLKDTFVQTDGSWNELTMERLRQEKRKKRKVTSKEETAKSHTRAANFTPIDKLKEKATAAAMKKQYSVYDYYKDEGLMQRLARHPFFHNLTILVVIANSVWLGVDADLNTETILFNAHPAIIVGENFFCIYFTLEIIVRFLAFQRKLNAFKDFWFSFDLFLALLIIVETWVTPVLLLLTGDLSGLPEGTVLLRLIRLVRLVRLTRLTRLLRSFPELMIIVKGLAFATRSVCVFSLLWAIITYAFAIIMRSLTEGSTIGTTFFKTVPESINTLLLPAVFGANADVINAIAKDNPGLWPIMVFFMALVSVTIMYMLLGVLVDVIGAVASTEKQKIEITYIVGQLREELDKLSIIPEDMALDQLEFQKLVLEPGIVRVMHESGVNVEVLAEMLDLVWEDASKAGTQAKTFTFSELVNMVLGMRGSNPATVKDCKEQIRVTNSLIKRCFGELYEELEDKFYQVRQEIQSMDQDFSIEDLDNVGGWPQGEDPEGDAGDVEEAESPVPLS